MAAKIGSHTFITLGGTLEPPGERTQTWTRNGVAGLGARKLGATAGEHMLRPVKDFTSNISRNTAILQLKALQGTVVTVQDDTGNGASCLIIEVTHRRSYNVRTAVGGVNGGRYMLEMLFRIQMKT